MLRPPFVLRDVIHSYIDFPEDLLGTAALGVLQTQAFQRLRRLHQLGLSRLIFPGAEHSRLSHSLGAYQLCRRALAELEHKGLIADLTESQRAAVGLAALLHDLGHGIFSHTAERIWDFDHEAVTDRLIAADPELVALWQDHLPGARIDREIVQIRKGDQLAAERFFLHDLVSSQFDVDRLDYLLRDAYMTGVHYAGFDLDWLLRHLTITTWNGRRRLAIEEKASDAMSQYLLARFHMYKNVYEHKTARIYDAMLQGLMELVRRTDPGELERVGLEWLAQPLAEDLGRFLALDDYSMWEAIKRLATAPVSEPRLRQLAGDLLADRRWDGWVVEEGVPARALWDGERFIAPFSRGKLYVESPETEILIVGPSGPRPLSEDPRVLRLSFTEPAMAICIAPRGSRPGSTLARTSVHGTLIGEGNLVSDHAATPQA